MSEKLIKDAGHLAGKPINSIAFFIERKWINVNYGARPYLDAMHHLGNIHNTYGLDSAKSIITYFLSNASSWRGEDARKAKAALRLHMKGAR